jgi:hypothetical protein
VDEHSGEGLDTGSAPANVLRAKPGPVRDSAPLSVRLNGVGHSLENAQDSRWTEPH